MLEVILVRHGETDSNVEGRYLGLTDVSLNENGINQALGLKDKLKDIRIDYVYSSPLKRCRETAGIINEAHNSAVLYSDDLKERNFGLFENLTYEEICNKYPVQKDLWENDWVNYRIEYGESALEFHKRICSFTDGILRQKHMGVMLVVAHSGCIRSIIAKFLGLGVQAAWSFKIDYCGVTRFEIRDNYPVMTLLNG